MVVFEIDLMALGFTTASPGVPFDVLNLLAADSGQAANFISSIYFLTDIRFQQAIPPAAIVD
ncbi:MAG: hypothetical protein IH899_04830 [Planctomycetes bacterium]|nr:hypothetical protein [Planctomycetota bacterium]